jgi:hypothetical protein
MKTQKQEYINPYIGGFLLGLVLLASIYFSGRGLGASGAIKSFVVSAVDFVVPQHTQNSEFYQQYTGGKPSALKSWLVFEVFGVFIGAFISGIVSNRMTLKIDKNPVVSSVKRLVFATIGGLFFGLGAQFARGCTSGAALSGMGVLATGGFITMLAIFGTGFLFAFLFKKQWVY